MAKSINKRNIPRRSYSYTRCPISLLTVSIPDYTEDGELRTASNGEITMRRLKFSELKAIAQVFSFSHTQEDQEGWYRCSFSGFQEKLKISRSCTNAAIQNAKRSKLIKQKKNFHESAEYQYTGEDTGFYITLEEYFFTKEFYIPRKAEKRRLSPSEAFILGLIASIHKIPGTEYFEGSVDEISKRLGLSLDTVKEALQALISAQLLHCKTDLYYQRNNKRLRITADPAILRSMDHKRKEDTEKPMRSRQQDEVKAADDRADRERYYADLQREAEDRARKYFGFAMADPEFKRNEEALRPLTFKIVYAEHLKRSDDVAALEKQQLALKVARAAILARLNLSERQFEPQYRCPICNDTGFEIKTGRQCNCYRARGKPEAAAQEARGDPDAIMKPVGELNRK